MIKILPRSPKRVVAKMMYIFQTYKNTVLENELIINMIVLIMNKDLTIGTYMGFQGVIGFLIKDLRRLRIGL